MMKLCQTAKTTEQMKNNGEVVESIVISFELIKIMIQTLSSRDKHS